MNCRRFDIFLADLKEFGIEEYHYIVIVSNWKANIKSQSINCCLISSQIKPLPSHVDFDGKAYGLSKRSQIKCENIYTLNKNKLKNKIGNISDIYLQLEIEKAIESQLQLNSKYINQDVRQIENLFMKRVNNMNNISKYEKIKMELREYAYSGNNALCVGKCTELIEILKKDKSDLKEYYQYAYYHRALMFIKLEEYEKCLQDAHESLKHIGDIKKETNNMYSYTMWIISSVYISLNMLDKSMSIYYTLLKYYKSTGRHNMRVIILFNIAKEKRKIHWMKILMKIMESMNFQEFETDKTKDKILKEMEKDFQDI